MSLSRLLIKATAPIVSSFFILAGIIQLRAQIWTVGTLCVLFAMTGFIFSMRLFENSPFTTEEVEVLQPYVVPMALWTIVFSLLAVSVSYVIDNFVSANTNRIAVATWVGSVIIGMILVWRNEFRLDRVRHIFGKLKAKRIELILLLVVLLVAISLRTIDLSNHPYPWSGDESSVGKEARRLISGEVTNYFDTGWSSQPNWSFVPTAVTQMIFGDNILGVRYSSVLAGTLAVLFVYLAGRELFNPAIGLLAGAFLATFPYNVHFSRIGVQNIMDSFLSSFVFWLLAKAMKTDDPRYYYTAGAVAGLAVYTYVGTRLVLILAFGVLLFFMIRQRSYFFSHWRHLLLFSMASVISVAPQAAFFARHPVIFIGRLGQEGIFINGWLPQHAALTGKSVLEILVDQVTRTVMVFIATPAVGNFYGSPYPYLTIFGSILFLLGMGYALAYLFQPKHFMILMWFWAVILFGGVLTMNPPANTRLLMTTPAIALFMALATYKIAEYLAKFRLLSERIFVPIFLVVVSVITYQSISFYMFEYRNNSYFQDANSEYAMEVGLIARGLGGEFTIFILGEPRVNSGIPTISYIAPSSPLVDLGAANLATFQLADNQKAAFFAIPESQALLAEIRARYPDGLSGFIYRKPRPNEVLFEYYIVTSKDD